MENKFITLAKITPPAVANENARIPRIKINKVCNVKNWSEDNLEPTESPKNIVTILIKAFCIVSESLSTTPHSLHRFPKVKAPIRGHASGRRIIHNPSTTSGNTIFHASKLLLTESFQFYVLLLLSKAS